MSLNRAQVVNDVKQILVDELFVDIPPEEIKEEDQLGASIGLDSIGLVELVTIVEDKYGIKVDEQQDVAENSRTLGTFVDYIVAKVDH